MKNFIESTKFNNFIVAVIFFNAIILGIDTMTLNKTFQTIISTFDMICLGIFIVEIILKLFVHRLNFFKNGWNIFDFLIVSLSLVPSGGSMSIFRALRIIRVLRLLSIIPKMKMIASALLNSLSGMFGVGILLSVFFYIYAVITTKLFSVDFPEYFGNIGRSLYSLFQIMTLESWSNGIVRPILKIYPFAWIIFVTFILLVSFIVLNMAIGIIVDSINEVQEEENIASENKFLEQKFPKLSNEIEELKRLLNKSTTS